MPMRIDRTAAGDGASAQLSSDGRCVFLYPRRKHADRGNAAVPQPQRGRKPIAIERSTVEAVFHMPQPDAAMHLGISLTSLKLVSRKLGLAKWPYRRECKLASTGQAKRTAHTDGAGVGAPRSPGPQHATGDSKAEHKALLALWQQAAILGQDLGAKFPPFTGVGSVPLAEAAALSQQSTPGSSPSRMVEVAEARAAQQEPSKLLPSLKEVRNAVKIISTRAVHLLMCAEVHSAVSCRVMETVGFLQWLTHRLFRTVCRRCWVV
jgi:hypothetical protein